MNRPDSGVYSRSVRERVSKRWRSELRERRFRASRTALVVVDMQNYYLSDRYSTFCAAGLEIVEPVNLLCRQTAELGVRILLVRSVALPREAGDWSNMYGMLREQDQNARYAALAEGAHGHAIFEGLHRQHASNTIDKTRFSAFSPGASDLHRQLGLQGIDTILVSGVLTNVCCDSTARDAMMLGYNAIMVHDCLAAATPEEHRVSLATFGLYFGEVLGASHILDRVDEHDSEVGGQR